MTCHAHIICFNEREILPYTIRHYRTFCERVVIHDMGSTDGSQGVAVDCGASVTQHDGRGEFDDRDNKQIKQESWKLSGADWVIEADADELIYCPGGVAATFAAYEAQKLAVIKPYGYEMTCSEYPTTLGQIYEEVKHGARDDYWYAKPILFNPRMVASIEFSTGAHTCVAKLKDRRVVKLDHNSPASTPSCYLLHFHHLGPLERVAKLYDENRARQSAINKKMKWGLQEPGLTHAKKKRAAILSRIERVLP